MANGILCPLYPYTFEVYFNRAAEWKTGVKGHLKRLFEKTR
ncbi:hypothetical protein ES703_62441 [subsurface metagenome]